MNNIKNVLNKYREHLDLPFGETELNEGFINPIDKLKQKKSIGDKMIAVFYNAVLSILLKILRMLIPKASDFMKQWIQDNIVEYLPVIEAKVKELEDTAKATPKMTDDILAFIIRAFLELVKSLLKVS